MKRTMKVNDSGRNGNLEKSIICKQNKRGGIMKKGVFTVFGLALLIVMSVVIFPNKGQCYDWYKTYQGTMDSFLRGMENAEQLAEFVVQTKTELERLDIARKEYADLAKKVLEAGSLDDIFSGAGEVVDKSESFLKRYIDFTGKGKEIFSLIGKKFDSSTMRGWADFLDEQNTTARAYYRDHLSGIVASSRRIEKEKRAFAEIANKAEKAETTKEYLHAISLAAAAQGNAIADFKDNLQRHQATAVMEFEQARQNEETKQGRHVKAFTPTEGEGNEEFHTRSSLNIWKK